MATISERVQVNRAPLDKWSKREQLCLASAVSCSGDQNWIAVSRTLKTVCGNEKIRPSDWYSQKNCALQYSYLLETVESTKRKKRENVAGVSSPLPVEPATELLLKRLTDDHMQDLKAQIGKDQEEYLSLCNEIKSLQTGQLSDDEVREIWRQIECQQDTERIDEMKMENRMREREQRKQEMWRNTQSPSSKRTTSSSSSTTTDTTAVDMDVEEIASGSAATPVSEVKPNTGVQQQQQQQQPQQPHQQPSQPAASSLLSTLLKSPTTTTAGIMPSSGTSLARTTAPTITTLLTSGNVSNQPALTIRSNIPASESAFITRPISGPPAAEQPLPAAANTLKSPSQAAPTLSMLLEKNKVTTNSAAQNVVQPPIAVAATTKPAAASTDANNEEVPMDIEDSSVAKTNETNKNTKTNTNTANEAAAAAAVEAETEETNAAEEQQLLEVFKNIGNMDDIDIDMADVIDDAEVDFIEDGGATSPSNIKGVDFEKELDKQKAEEIKKTQDELTSSQKPSEESEVKAKEEDSKAEVVVASSDESNDNIPLAEVATLEQKDRSQEDIEPVSNKEEKSADESANNAQESVAEKSTEASEEINDKTTNDSEDKSTNNSPVAKEEAPVNATEDSLQEATKKESSIEGNSESSDVILISSDDHESVFEKPALAPAEIEKSSVEKCNEVKTTNPNPVDELEAKATVAPDDVQTKKVDEAPTQTQNAVEQKPDASKSAAESTKTKNPTKVISITDNDDDSSVIDVSKDEAGSKKSTVSVAQTTQRTQKLPKQEESKTETGTEIAATTTTTTTTTAAPVASTTTAASAATTTTTTTAPTPVGRASTMRKPRDNDRSESPMIEDETTTTSEQSVKPSTRRRYSSTPIIDSIPNSPASSEHLDDRRETRGASKKMFLNIYNHLFESKHAAIFRRAFIEEHAQKYNELCYRPMDLPTIKRNIDAGVIRSATELQRDVLLMCHNILVLYKPHTSQYKSAYALQQECQSIKEFAALANAHHDMRLGNTSITKSRSGARKSQRLI